MNPLSALSAMSHQHHSYHIVEPSPWPLLLRLTVGLMAMRIVCAFHLGSWSGLGVSVLLIILGLYQWGRDICREATFQGHHTVSVQHNMRWGILLFISSEVLFFFSFFWAYFNSSLSSDGTCGFVWPPVGIPVFNPFGVPLLNTIILLSSGATVTWAHHSLVQGDYSDTSQAILVTILLGLLFVRLQAFEYHLSPFTISDSSYGATFFILTGFHGGHVIIGATILTLITIRAMSGHFTQTHHFGLEAGIWYWHFVDVVWIGLFTIVYWWGR